jgi:hypothetical protein
MSHAQHHASLLLRLRQPAPDRPGEFPIDVTLDGTASLTGVVTVRPEELSPLESKPWEYGKRLGDALFADEGVRRALAYARGAAELVTVGLQIDAPELGDLLWERAILANGAEEMVLATSNAVALSRHIPSERPAAVAREGPFRLLALVSSPTELATVPEGSQLTAIDVATEIGALRNAWDPLVTRGQLQVSVLARMPDAFARDLASAGYRVFNEAATLDRFADLVTSADSVHIIAHGAFKSGQTSLLLEDADGRSEGVSEAEFVGRLGDRTLRLVFLQACQSAARRGGHANVWSGLAPRLTTRAAAVIAMQDFVRVQDARRFAQEFYDMLLATGSAHRAVNAGRRALYRPDSGGWSIPALYLGPAADPIWQPDAVLTAVQDLADQFRKRPEVNAPFPIEVVRQWPDVSSKMETSPPGPRVRMLEAVTAALAEATGNGTGLVVIAGNYGRAKTAQLWFLYTHFASRVAEDGRLPLFAQISEFQPGDDLPDVLIARAISRTYEKCGITLPARALHDRLRQSVVLFVDSDVEADNRRRTLAFDAIRQFTSSSPHAVAVVTLDEHVLGQIPELGTSEAMAKIPILIVQLLSPGALGQYLTTLDCKPLLSAIRRANLFDLAGTPWLLAHLLRQPHRCDLSRSGVIQRVVNANLASAGPPAGVRRILHDLLGRVAWHLQTRQSVHLESAKLYELLDQVRGRREISLEQLKAHALETKLLSPCEEDGVRFSYPGFQSHWCAQYLLDSGRAFSAHLNDITATLGRRSRVRLWEDTLVLLAGLMQCPDRLLSRILAGSTLSHGEHVFLAARCVHEAKLADRPVGDEIIEQVVDTLIWRSTPIRESRASVRVRAIESLAMLNRPETIPHLISLAVERVRPTFNGEPTFELSGLRHAALQALMMMQDDVEQHVRSHPPAPGTPYQEMQAIVDAWREGDSKTLRRIFLETEFAGLPGVIAFALGTLGGPDNLTFLADRLLHPATSDDTQWSIADSLLLFNVPDVVERVIPRMCETPALHAHAAYMIGRLRTARPNSPEMNFLVKLLHSPDITARGAALKALGRLGESRYREDCELIAGARWDQVARRGVIAVPKRSRERTELRVRAIETLRLIGTRESLAALRKVRNWRPKGSSADRDHSELMQLSYEACEEIYWRVTGGLEGDFLEPVDDTPPRN